MNDIEQTIDRAVELERDADIDALSDAALLPFQVIEPEPVEVYDEHTWHNDCADLITSGDPKENDYIRKQLGKALAYMGEMPYSTSARSKILTAQCLNHIMMNIGGQIIENAVANGLTAEKMGDSA